MKIRKTLFLLFSFPLLICSFSCATRAVSTVSPVTTLLDEQNFKFKAEFATPLGGRQILLTGPYELTVTKESLTANLPYFGVAYRAPIGVDENGIKFSSKDFKYALKERKRGWSVHLRPSDTQEVRTLNLFISSSGNATLQVTSNYRQSISFSGKIVKAGKTTW